MSVLQFFVFFLGGVLWCLIDSLGFKHYERKYSKKCNYECSKCKAWHCRYKTCFEKRKKYLETMWGDKYD